MRISDWSSDVCSSDLVVSLAELYHANKQPAEAVTTLQKAIQAKKATNEAVPETWYKRMLAIAYDAKRMDLAVPASLDLVSARSEEHTSELQSLMRISYAVFCLKKKKSTFYQNTKAKISPDIDMQTHTSP